MKEKTKSIEALIKMKEKIKSILGVLVYIIIMGFFLISGIYDVCGGNTYYNANIIAASELFETEHTINGLIPCGRDYYYVGLTDDEQLVVLRASQNWISENFDEDGYSLSEQGVAVKGTLKLLSYDEQGAVEDALDGYQNFSVLSTSQSLDIMYFDVAVHSIIAGSLLIVLGIVGLIIWKNQKLNALFKNNIFFIIGSAIVIIAFLAYLVYVITLK